MSVKASILIIDDEQEIRESLEELLKLEGYAPETAETAEEGLRQVQAQVYDLVLLDVNLPGSNGLELLKSIKQESPELGVIMITAYDSSDVAFRASKEGAASYITKPWNNDRLLIEI